MGRYVRVEIKSNLAFSVKILLTKRKTSILQIVLRFSEEMDDTDRVLVLLLEQNPRMSLRELSKRLGISRQSLHRRLQGLARMGVFRNLRACVAGDYIDEFAVAIWGRSDSTSLDSTLERLGKSKFTWRVEVLGGNALFVIAGLVKISDLSAYVEFVKDAAEMSEPTVGVMCYENGINLFDREKKESYKELSPLDLKIINQLQDDARKPATEIAKAVGVSAKTAQKHLDEMISEGSMVFNQPWDVTSGGVMLTLFFVKLRSGADKVRAAKRLLSKDPVHLTYLRSFSNIPGLLIGLLSSEHMREIRKILREIAEDEDVLTVTPNLIYDERIYWDQDPRSPGTTEQSTKKARKKKAPSVLKAE